MTKQITRRRVAKPATPGIKALITTASIAATLGGWALFAKPDSSTQAIFAQQAAVTASPPQVFAMSVPALPAIDALPTIVPPPSNLAELGISAAPIQQQPAQAPAAVPDVKQLAPNQSLRVVKAPPAPSRKPAPAPVTTTRSSR